MRQLRYVGIYLLSSLVLLIAGCNINPKLDDLNWQPDYLGPIAKSTIDLQEITNLKNVSVNYTVQANELDINNFEFGIPIDVPPFGPQDFPPQYFHLSNYFSEITVDSLLVNFSFNNIFPIPISANTEIVTRDSLTNEVLFVHVIDREIAPGELYVFPAILVNKSFTNSISFAIEKFTSPGGTNVVFMLDDLNLAISIEFLQVKRILLLSNLNYELEGTNEASLDFGFDLQNYSGTLSLFIENNFPIETRLDLKFLDENKDTIYSIFGDTLMTVASGTVDGSGLVIAPAILDLRDLVNLDDLTLFEEARFLYSKAYFQTAATPSSFEINNDNYLNILLTGDITIDDLANELK